MGFIELTCTALPSTVLLWLVVPVLAPAMYRRTLYLKQS
jgi:hypothetical protein